MVVVHSLVCLLIVHTVKSDMGLYDLPMLMSLVGFDIGMMFANFHVCEMTLCFNAKSKRSDVF